MKHHEKFTDMFSRSELDLIEKCSSLRAWNKQEEIYSIMVDTEGVSAEIYADDPSSQYVRIMCFQPNIGPITRGELLQLLRERR